MLTERSERRTSVRLPAETANDRASMAIVGPAPTTPTATPASAGPTMKPRLATASTVDDPAPMRVGPTRIGTDAVQPAMKATRSALRGNITRYTTGMTGRPRR